MLLILDDEHKEHLSFLTSVEVDVVREFCKIAMGFLRKGANPKIYQGAAQKLSVSPETIQHGVEGLMYLLTECAKLMVNEIDFQDSILVLGFSEELKSELLQLYLENRKEIRRLLSDMTLQLPHYHTLEWRLDVQVASRTLRHQVQPSVVLKLHTTEEGETKAQVLETDATNLAHLASSLEGALNEMKGQHCRRILRNIK
ncbi:COMM domain-containing protein 2-like [Sycon ciliatum]|uniref:COMM domain-containing protein 2-like n=1 Tax=Sycon ciliatum TaxID=27933 RepID=UPI0020AAC80B|eukprot:scpid87097/ scgid11517/ COMM domain-containing protein 2